jgi:hypothetical protein
MAACTAPYPHPDADRLDAMADQAIAACGGNAHDTVKALLVANEYLEAEVQELQAAVSSGYARSYRHGRFRTIPAEWSKAMAEVTYYVALPFVAADDGIAAGEPVECFNPAAVVMRAEALSHKEGIVGAVAFSRTGDPATGDFSDATVIKKFGDVPDDLGAM